MKIEAVRKLPCGNKAVLESRLKTPSRRRGSGTRFGEVMLVCCSDGKVDRPTTEKNSNWQEVGKA